MSDKTDKISTMVAISCGVFKDEILALKDRHWPDLTIEFLSSMLHMKPDKLASILDARLTGKKRQEKKALLIYGDCCMKMTDFTQQPGIVRVQGNNCCQMMLGATAYRRLSHEGAFFLFPEWVRRWQHIFSAELGLNRSNAKSLMGEMHSKLMYIDTGVAPIPVTDLNECSHYCGLPWEALTVSLEPLRERIQAGLDLLTEKDMP